MRGALLNTDGIVVNIIEYDTDEDYNPPAGLTLVENASLAIGDHWDGTVATPPDPVITPPSEATTLDAVAFVARNTVSSHLKAATFDFANFEKVSPLFPIWAPDLDVAVGDIYTYNGELVEVVQAHTTQADWTPDITPALWKVYRAPDAVTEWIQPTGAQDAYALGAKVTYNGKTWSSNVDANVWAPPTQWTEVV